MFCRNCGQPYPTDQAVVCVKCGTQKGMGTNFCHFCGQPAMVGSIACTNCGVSLQGNAYIAPNAKSKIAAGLLGIFLGAFGVHNFYLGYTAKGVIQLVLTLVSCGILSFISGIWGMIEGILILTGSINTDAKGNFLKD